MKEIVFKYLDRRYSIIDGVITILDDDPIKTMSKILDINQDLADELYTTWFNTRFGCEYCINIDDVITCFKDGKYHRLDGPAVIYPDGTEEWCQNGDLHRDNDLPARTYPSGGGKEWYKNGYRHREDGPAIIYADGQKEWYLNGKLHRLDGPAIIHPDGGEAWYLNGKEHREDGPAIKRSNGTEEWYKNGELHRDDGPAVIWRDGCEFWWKNGRKICNS